MSRRSGRSSTAAASAAKPAKPPTPATAKEGRAAAAPASGGGGRQTQLQLPQKPPAKADDDDDEEEEEEAEESSTARPAAAKRAEEKAKEEPEVDDPYALPGAAVVRSTRASASSTTAASPSPRKGGKKGGKGGSAEETGDLERLLELVDSIQQWKANSTKETLLKTLTKAARVLVDYRALATSPTPSTADIPNDHRPLLKTVAKALVQKSILHNKADEVHPPSHTPPAPIAPSPATCARGSPPMAVSGVSAAPVGLLLPRRCAAHLRTQPPLR